VFADYILTNAASAARAARLGIVERGDDNVPLPTVGVHEDYLHAALAAIEKEAGSVETYLVDVLGVSHEMRARLKSRFVV
jgi:protein tyrosine/serine phosphatase